VFPLSSLGSPFLRSFAYVFRAAGEFRPPFSFSPIPPAEISAPLALCFPYFRAPLRVTLTQFSPVVLPLLLFRSVSPSLAPGGCPSRRKALVFQLASFSSL